MSGSVRSPGPRRSSCGAPGRFTTARYRLLDRRPGDGEHAAHARTGQRHRARVRDLRRARGPAARPRRRSRCPAGLVAPRVLPEPRRPRLLRHPLRQPRRRALDQDRHRHRRARRDRRVARRARTSKAPYSLLDMAADTWGLCDHLGFDRVHLVGLSLGGMIVQQMAIDRPRPGRVAHVAHVHHRRPRRRPARSRGPGRADRAVARRAGGLHRQGPRSRAGAGRARAHRRGLDRRAQRPELRPRLLPGGIVQPAPRHARLAGAVARPAGPRTCPRS